MLSYVLDSTWLKDYNFIRNQAGGFSGKAGEALTDGWCFLTHNLLVHSMEPQSLGKKMAISDEEQTMGMVHSEPCANLMQKCM